MAKKYSGQRLVPSTFWLQAFVLLMSTTAQAAGVVDDSDPKVIRSQEFNFRIDAPDQKQVDVSRAQKVEPTPLVRSKRLPTTTNVGFACPILVHPEFPRKAQQEGIESAVTAQFRIKGGVIQEVTIVEGHPVYDASVIAAIMQYKCISQPGGEAIVTQTFNFRLE